MGLCSTVITIQSGRNPAILRSIEFLPTSFILSCDIYNVELNTIVVFWLSGKLLNLILVLFEYSVLYEYVINWNVHTQRWHLCSEIQTACIRGHVWSWDMDHDRTYVNTKFHLHWLLCHPWDTCVIWLLSAGCLYL